MTKEREQRLVGDFPELFREYKKEGTCMAIGFACDDGWFDLVHDLSSEIAVFSRENGVVAKAKQVKEKFGGLRFYVAIRRKGPSENGQEEMEIAEDETDPVPVSVFQGLRAIVDAAEKKSFRICEICGQPGECGSIHGWRRTLCPPCHAREEARKGGDR